MIINILFNYVDTGDLPQDLMLARQMPHHGAKYPAK